MSQGRKTPSTGGKSTTLLDCQSIFQLVDRLRSQFPPTEDKGKLPSFDYRVATEFLDKERQSLGFGPTHREIAFATYDPDSDAQSRFFAALGHRGILVEPIDFRIATPTFPIASEFERIEFRSVMSQVTYALGLLAGRDSPAEVVVVTRCFDVFAPLLDLVRERKGKAAIAFFKRFLDGRWASQGLFDPDFAIKFIDLEPVSSELLGVDLNELTPTKRFATKGLAGL